MKTILSILLLVSITFQASAQNNDEVTSNETGKSEILIAYFSHTGNTRTVAGYIQELTGGDLFEIEAAQTYPTDYQQCVNRAQEEKNTDARPELATLVENIDQYETIFIGYPIWWWIQPMLISSFIEAHDLRGKTIVPFCTYLSRHDDSFSLIAEKLPESNHLEGLAVTHAASARPDVESWLKRIGVSGGDPTSISTLPQNSSTLFTVENNGGRIMVALTDPSNAGSKLNIYNVMGGAVFSGNIQQSHSLALNKGLYLFNLEARNDARQTMKYSVR